MQRITNKGHALVQCSLKDDQQPSRLVEYVILNLFIYRLLPKALNNDLFLQPVADMSSRLGTIYMHLIRFVLF